MMNEEVFVIALNPKALPLFVTPLTIERLLNDWHHAQNRKLTQGVELCDTRPTL